MLVSNAFSLLPSSHTRGLPKIRARGFSASKGGLMVAGREATPGDAKIVAEGKKYWVAGPGAAKISWGQPGDFSRCITEVQAAVTKDGKPPLPDHMIKGYCAELHKAATGATPGHAPGEQAGHH